MDTIALNARNHMRQRTSYPKLFKAQIVQEGANRENGKNRTLA
ncbi:hypothetical protein ALQ61_03774 [Pseudomonas coronafaciens pv. zizaniae]|nr:hypothetical protein ALQ61_03774 [Pseudomonas coronafaciens pv. zizaniae]